MEAKIEAKAEMKAEVKAEVEAEVEAAQVGGVNYQSVLPIGMVVILTILTLKDAFILWCVLKYSHQREVLRLKNNGATR